MRAIDRRSRLGTLIVIVLVSVGCGGSLGGGAGPGGRPGQGGGRAGASGLGGRSGLGGSAGSTGIGGAENLGGAFGTGAGGSGRPFGGAAGTSAGTGGVTGTGGSMCMHSAAGEVPSEHRPVPPSCESNPPIPLVSGGFPSCATGADCTSQGYGSCTAGHCVNDFCLADGDCQKGYVCACGGETRTVSPPAGATDARTATARKATSAPAAGRPAP